MFFNSITKNCLAIKAHCYRKIQTWVYIQHTMFVTVSILGFLFREYRTPELDISIGSDLPGDSNWKLILGHPVCWPKCRCASTNILCSTKVLFTLILRVHIFWWRLVTSCDLFGIFYAFTKPSYAVSVSNLESRECKMLLCLANV